MHDLLSEMVYISVKIHEMYNDIMYFVILVHLANI